MVVICDASDVAGCGRRRIDLSNAPLHIEQYTSSLEENALKLQS